MRVISNSEIESLHIPESQVLKWVNEAFSIKYSCELPKKISQKIFEGDGFYNTMPCIMPPINSAGVKIVSRYPNRIPSIQGNILLYDYQNGQSLATFDAEWITRERTGAVAALAVELFAHDTAKNIAIIGLGETGNAFLRYYVSNKLNLKNTIKLFVYKDHAEKAEEFLRSKGVGNVKLCSTYEELIVDSDVVVSAVTVAHDCIGKDEWFKPGVLVVPIHSRGFQNCDLFFDKVFADDTNHVVDFKHYEAFRCFNELSKVLLRQACGRESQSERILSYNIGIALHDILMARKILTMLDGLS